jgi:hypothetical protein
MSNVTVWYAESVTVVVTFAYAGGIGISVVVQKLVPSALYRLGVF